MIKAQPALFGPDNRKEQSKQEVQLIKENAVELSNAHMLS